MEQEREDRFVIIRFDILTDKKLSASEKLVYARICGFKKYFESKEEAAELLGVSSVTVTKAKQKLLKYGYIREIGNTGRGKIYQSVLDDEARVVESTNQSGKKLPIRVVESTNIEETENKDRVNTVAKATGDAVEVYGNADINDAFEYWEKNVGFKIQGRVQANRNACSNLIKKFGSNGVHQLINAAAVAHNDRYAPRVSDFASMQSKLNDLVAWAKKKGTSQNVAKF